MSMFSMDFIFIDFILYIFWIINAKFVYVGIMIEFITI